MKKNSISNSSPSGAAHGLVKFLVPLFCLASTLSQGATYGLTGTGNWDTAIWSIVGTPGAADTVNLTTAGQKASLVAGTSITTLGMTASSTIGSTGGPFTLTVTGGGNSWSTASTILSIADGTTISRTGAATTISGNGAGIALAGGSIIEANGASAAITFSGAASATHAVTGTGTIRNVGSGKIRASATADGVVTTVASGVSFMTSSSSSVDVVRGALVLNSTTATLQGTLAYSGASASSFEYAGGNGVGTLTVNDLTVSNSGSSKSLTFTSGTLSFANSTLSIATGAPLTVAGGTVTGTAATGSGTGAINLTGNTVAMTPGGVATAGDLNFGTLPVTWSGTTQTLTIDVAQGAAADDHIIAGAVNLGAGLSLTINNLTGTAWTPANTGTPNKITIINGSSLAGTFVGLADESLVVAGGQTFMVDYTSAGDVDLIAVPEPAHYAGAIGLGLVGFAALRRHRNSRKA